MSKVISDNNLICDLFFGDKIRQCKASEWRTSFPVWYAPDLWRYEFGNVLRSQVAFRGMEKQGAEEMLERALKMISPSPFPVSEAEILSVSIDLGLTYYDATYVAHARKAGLKLLTRDKDILKLAPDISIPIDG